MALPGLPLPKKNIITVISIVIIIEMIISNMGRRKDVRVGRRVGDDGGDEVDDGGAGGNVHDNDGVSDLE